MQRSRLLAPAGLPGCEAAAGDGAAPSLPFDAAALLRVLRESVIVTDARLDRPGPTILYVNPAFEQLFGWSAQEVIGQSPRLFQGKLTDLDIFRPLRDLLEAGEIWSGSTINYRRDGTQFQLEWSIVGLHDAEGRLIQCVAVQYNASAQVADARAMARALREAQIAARARTVFMASMAQTMCAPLNAIVGLAEMLESQGAAPHDTARNERYASLIHDGATRLLGGINDLLDFTSCETGQLQLDESPVELRALLEGSLSVLAPTAARRGIALALAPGDKQTVTGDAARLSQIVVALAGNAIKYCARGDRVDIAMQDGADGSVTISVRDTGPGIAAEQQQAVFDPFAQGAAKRDHAGAGLGLAICRRLAALHGGDIELISDVGHGAEFRLILPAARCRLTA